ncbi:MAG: sugar phosphate isomerase/epimerase family protein [Armatimonadota bacterium]|nr:sugar phosphate isomerase/epimerase family protein [Armatimonadota bacterium]
MRLGGPVFGDVGDPGGWVEALRRLGYRAAFCPVNADADENRVQAYVDAARAADVVIAEVGAWSNPISPDRAVREAALEKCRRQLHLADRVGARCCVNIAGSRGEQWDGPHPNNLTEETFDLIVESVRAIIDAVKPIRTCYTLETMPWVFPNSPESYLRLIRAIDRKQFGVHLDPVNLVNSPERYFRNGDLIRECFAMLGPYIKSCHAKDILLSGKLTVHLDEVRVGLGALDYTTYLRELAKLPGDTPLMLEHLGTAEDYALAAAHVRAVAAKEGIAL